MRFCKIILLFLALGISAPAQQKLDSLKRVLQHTSSDTEKVNTMLRIAYATSDTTVIKKYADAALDLSQKIGFEKGEGSANVALGNLYERFQLHVQAVRYYTEALKIREELGDKKGTATCYMKLAVINGKFKNYDKAILLLRKAKALNLEINNQDGVSLDDQSLAQMYQSSEKWDSAIFYYNKTLAVPNQNIVTIAVTYINVISVYIGKQQFDSAITYIHKCDSVYGILHNSFGPLWNKMNMGQIYLLKGDTKHAIENLELVYNYGEQQHNADLLLNVLPMLIDAYRKSGDAVKGFKVQTEWITLKDSLENVDQATAILGEQVKYEQEQKEKIDKLQKAKDKAETEAKENRQRIIIYSVSAILLLVLGMSFFIFRGYQQKKKANEIISHQKEMVEEKQKEIVDSITYAKRLQEAILPPLAQIKESFPESFVLYLPKDIVAGDFYWMEKLGETTFIAAADCTGHGVPGAMVSVVCSNALNRAVKEFNITDPGKILDKVRELVIETFEKSESEVKDGMDISLLRIEKLTTDNRQLFSWSGAHNPLWFVHDGNVVEMKADKFPVGLQENAGNFTTRSLQLAQGSLVYLFTDGYADQFGGPKGKKFRYKQLEELILTIANLPMEEQRERFEKAFIEWKGNLEQVDDVCIIGIRV